MSPAPSPLATLGRLGESRKPAKPRTFVYHSVLPMKNHAQTMCASKLRKMIQDMKKGEQIKD